MDSNPQGQENSHKVVEVVLDTKKALRTNPFTTYRDPETGRWIVIKANVAY